MKDRVIIITGGASGIGLAAAKRFAREAARVVIIDLNDAKNQEASAAVKASGAQEVLAMHCDCGDESQVEKACNQVMEKFKRIDVVVNNAGLMIFKPIVELAHDDWHKILSVDLLGAFYFTRFAFKHMQAGGAIVNISSVHALETDPLVAPYAAAKAALLSLTRSSALEGKPLGIRVNAVLPGAIDTPMLWNNPNVKSGLENIAKRDVGTPEDIAEVIFFLASDQARFIQGASVVVDGGRLDRLG